MSRELSHLYDALATDADGSAVADPEVLRRRADRRARTRVAATVVAAAVLAGGIAIGTQLVLASTERGPLPPPADTPTPVVTTPAPSPTTPPSRPSATATATAPTGAPGSSGGGSPAAPRVPASVPDRAFFAQPAATTAGSPPVFVDGAALPKLCGARYPSDASLVQRRTRHLIAKLPATPVGNVPDGSYQHSIASYRSGHAADWMGELRQAVRSCPEQQSSQGTTSRQRLLTDSRFGDESVLFEVRTPFLDANGDPTGDEEIRLIRAIRVGEVVTVLWEQGWEGSSTERTQFDDYSRRGVAAIEAWLD
jgi:hypothetical protein